MYCANCGAKMQEGQNYCVACGKPLSAATVPPAPSNTGASSTASERAPRDIAKHIRLLGTLWLVYSALRFLPAVAAMTLGRFGFFPHLGLGRFGMPFMPMHFPGFVGPLFASFGVLLLGSAVVGFLAGWGLLERASWARPLALVLGVLNLFHMPLGTALGIYTLWVLLPSQSKQEFGRMARAA